MWSSLSDQVVPALKPSSRLMWKRYRKARKCVGSKFAIFILFWSFLIGLIQGFLINLSLYQIPFNLNVQNFLVADSCFSVLIYLLYPIAGLLADLKFGHYKTTVLSTHVTVFSAPVALVGSGLLVASTGFEKSSQTYIILVTIGSIISGAGVLLLICSVVAFNASLFQFGLDQLHDSPAEDHIIFIQWLIWTFYASNLIFVILTDAFNFSSSISIQGSYSISAVIFTAIVIILVVVMQIAHRKKKWFVISKKGSNPYQLVHLVTRFAKKHSFPVHRSAFTYCEDEIPSGLDLGKMKYGGPFTTEQVEDVKVFYGVLKILLSIGPIFSLIFAANSIPVIFRAHVLKSYYYNFLTKPWNLKIITKFVLFEGSIFYDALPLIILPFHIILIRPFLSYYIPRTRVRMGMGILSSLITLVVSLVMEVLANLDDPTLTCMLSTDPVKSYTELNSTADVTNTSSVVSSFYYIGIVQQTVSRLFNLITLIAMFEFVLAQSPHAMKGLLIGISFAIRGLFQWFGALMVLPFSMHWHASSMPSCGTIYLIMNIVIGTMALVVFVYNSKKYKNRIRDEPCRVYHYVEEYYSKIPDES